MSVKAFIFLFPILFLLLIPVTAGEEPLDINITFREFYEVNISGALAKNIGVAGLGYHPTVYVNSTSKEVDLTNRSLEVTFNYEGFNPRNLPIFGYEGHFDRNVTFPINFSLADELNNGECSFFQFEIQLLKPGSYWVEWFEIVDGKSMEGSGMRIQIIEPYEWENIIKQANLIEASERTAFGTTLLAIGTFVLGFLTFLYVIFTLWLVSEKRKVREAQTKPNISVIIQSRDELNFNFIDRVIQNIGLGPAYNINFKIKSDVQYNEVEMLSKLGFIKNGLKYLAPNQKLQSFLTNMLENFEEKIKIKFEIEINYENCVGKTYKDSYLIDFSQLKGLETIGEPPIYKISKRIESIKDDLHTIKEKYTK